MAVEAHAHVLEALAAKGRLRGLTHAGGLDFTSNDYLALAQSPLLRTAAEAALARGVPLGAGGSRLLRGNHPEHEALEEEAAAFFGSQTALFFPTGFAANAAIAACLPRRGDLIVHDRLIHASFRDGLNPGRVTVLETPHNDCGASDAAISRWRAGGGRGRVWIAAETLYSMDGDRAPLGELAALAARHDAMLLLDEAHATGVYGPQGRGLAAALEGRDNVIILHTCGKALGAMGALVTMPRALRDFMVNRSRSFIYSTAPSPLIAATVRAALKIAAAADTERAGLAARVAHAGHLMQSRLVLSPSGSQIQPIIVGSDGRATALAAALQKRGYDIRAIRPPTVPEGTARLRIALTLHTDIAALDALFADLAAELEKIAGVNRTFVVTGTDTGIGKTIFAAALTAAIGGVYWKPVQAGLDGETDSQIVARLSGVPVLPETWRLKLAASPHRAAAAENLAIDSGALALPDADRPLVVEGAGGLMVPLDTDTLFIDVFARWGAPLILCARTSLGTINHSLLSLEAIRARAIPLLGIAFVGEANPDSESIICRIGRTRRLGRLGMMAKLDAAHLRQAFHAGFDIEDFR